MPINNSICELAYQCEHVALPCLFLAEAKDLNSLNSNSATYGERKCSEHDNGRYPMGRCLLAHGHKASASAYSNDMRRILCIEDGQDTRLLLEATLRNFEVQFADTLAKASHLLSSRKFALALLDIGLPDGSGLDFLADCPEKFENTPVILLTSSSDFASKVSAFSLGADDFIQKPFDPKELRLRVEAKIRKSEHLRGGHALIRVGNLVCDLFEQRAYPFGRQSNEISLTALEFKILVLLAKAPSKIFSRAEILDRVWGAGQSTTERSVDVHVSNVRKKILVTNVDIEGVIGAGYRLRVLSGTYPDESVGHTI